MIQKIGQENEITLQKLEVFKSKIQQLEQASILKKESAAREALLAALNLFGQLIYCQLLQTKGIISIEESLQNLRTYGNLEGVGQ